MKNKITLALLLIFSLFSWNAMAQTQVTVAGSASGNGSYSTLAAAIAAIGLTGQSGNNITIAISASTTEVATTTIGNGNWTTLKIYPTANTVTCLSVYIALSGAKNVTIDGRLNATGTTTVGASTSLTLSSTSTTNPVISFDSDAQSNFIQYCNIKIGAVTTTGGITFGATATTTNGNGNNVIDHNLITPSNGIAYAMPTYAIYAQGNSVSPNIGNIISNNEFKDLIGQYFTSTTIYILGGTSSPQNDNYTISGNSFYSATLACYTNVVTKTIIQIGAPAATFGGSHTITGNYIGGNAASCSGTLTKTDIGATFNGMLIYPSGVTATSIQNNTIQNISWTNGYTSTGTWTGINIAGSGSATITGNSIGDNSSTGSIKLSNYAGGGPLYAIYINNTGATDCEYNKIGSITTSNTGSVNSNIWGIDKTATAGTTTISNNTIGSTITGSSINASSLSTTQTVTGILTQGTGTNNVNNNTIANLVDNASTGTIFSINVNGGSTVNANLIHSNSIIGATTATVYGIWCGGGSNTLTNNIIRLGDNNSYEIRGIGDGSNTNNINFNTVYLSGSPISLALNSACLWSSQTSARTYENNILVNARSNSTNGTTTATGKHYALNITTTGSITADYNDYFVNGTGGVSGSYAGSDKSSTSTIVTGKDTHSKNVDPSFATAGGTNAVDYKPNYATLTGLTISGINTDYAGNSRSTPIMGAIQTISPSITAPVPATAAAFTTTYGTASAAQTFAVGGTLLFADLVATAPTGFEVSNGGVNYGNTATFSRPGGTASGTLYIRLAATAGVSGTYNSQTIVLSSSGATSINIVTTTGNAVTPKALTITATDVNKTYGTAISGGSGSAAFTASSLVNSETIGTVNITYGTGSAATASVGTYSTSAVVPSAATGGTFTASNYSISYANGNIIVAAKALTIGAASIASKVYNGTTTSGTVTPGSLSGFYSTETVTVSTAVGIFANANVGTGKAATIVYTLANGNGGGLASNYSLANGSANGDITAKPLSVTGYSIAAKNYNGSTTSGTISIGTITGFVGTETVTATASCTLSSPNVYGEQGTIVFTLVNGTNGGLASNYSLANGSYWAQINQAQLNITAGNQTVTYGTAASAVTAAGTYTPSGFIGSDNSGLMTGTATYTTTYTNTTAVGTAGVTITYNTGLNTTYSNYWMNKIAGTITITAATPTVTPTVSSYTYTGSPQGPNAATNTGTGSSYTYSYAGVAPTVYSASSTAPTEAGTYTVTVTVAANGNYASASSAATAFTIYSTGVVTAANTNVSSLVLSTASDISITGSGSLVIDVNNTSVHTVTAAPGTQLTISSGKSLSLSGNLQLQSDASGTATLVDQTTSGGLTVSGTSTVQQYLAGARNWYISSPVSAAKAQNSYTFYRRDEANNAWPSMTAGDGVTTGDALNVGQGYIANLASGTATYTFTGTLNTNDKAIGLSYSNGVSKAGFNLIGNPYPSHYTVTKSATDAANALNTIWYRTATWVEDLITPANSKYVYSFQTCLLNSDNVTYVGTPSGTTPIIPPMQSFWVRTNTAGSSFTFANTQRSHQNSNLLKAPAQKNVSEPILRLQVSNGTISDETVLYSNSNASDAYDSYDALKMNNNSSSVPEIYTLVDNQQVAINGLNNIPFEKEIPIGFTTLSSGMFSIKASQISNFSSGTQLIFKDYTDVNNPVITDLSDGSSYSFSSAVTSNNISRFALIFHAPTIATGSNPGSNSNVWISTCNGQIMINGIGTSEANLELFNALGQKVSSKNLTKTNNQLSTNLAAGAYLLKITIEGKTITRKIIID